MNQIDITKLLMKFIEDCADKCTDQKFKLDAMNLLTLLTLKAEGKL